MLVPAEAIALARTAEGLYRVATRVPVVTVVPYICPAGILTIGRGHTGADVVEGLIWSVEQAEDALQQDMAVAHAQALALCPSLATASPGRRAAIADFVFNLGGGRLRASTLRRKINDGAWGDVPAELRKWVWGGGRRLPGLVHRREAEIALL
jgi:lysozyme